MDDGRKFDPAKLEKLEGAHRYDRERPEALVALASLEEGATIVDLGAGTGFFSRAFLAGVPRCRVLACDQAQAMVDHVRSEHVPRWDGRLEVHLCGEVAVPLPDGVADLVFWANLYHELHDPEASLAEGMRLLRPGGRIMIVDWKAEETGHGPPGKHRVHVDRVRAALAEAGFLRIEAHDLLEQHHVVTAARPGKESRA